jgi:hypothetical protein
VLDAELNIGVDIRPCRGLAMPRAFDGLLYVQLMFRCEQRAVMGISDRYGPDWGFPKYRAA